MNKNLIDLIKKLDVLSQNNVSGEAQKLVTECRDMAQGMLDGEIAELKEVLVKWRDYTTGKASGTTTASAPMAAPSPAPSAGYSVPSSPPSPQQQSFNAGNNRPMMSSPPPHAHVMSMDMPNAGGIAAAGQKKAVLVVDDDKDIQRILGFFLPTKGFEVMSISDPEAALELLERVHPDIILMDLMMPKMTGFELLQRIKKRADWNDIRIIVGSMRNYDKDRLAVLKYGADEFIPKPYNLDELAMRIQYLAG